MRFQNLKNVMKLHLDEHPLHIIKNKVVFKSEEGILRCLFFCTLYPLCAHYFLCTFDIITVFVLQ